MLSAQKFHNFFITFSFGFREDNSHEEDFEEATNCKKSYTSMESNKLNAVSEIFDQKEGECPGN